MTDADMVIYKILIWAVPALLSILAFVGALAVSALLRMARDLNEIKNKLTEVDTKQDALDERVDRLEAKVFP